MNPSLPPVSGLIEFTNVEDIQAHLAWQSAELEILQHVRVALTESGEMTEIIGRTVVVLVDLLGYTHVGAYLVEDGELHLVRQAGFDVPLERLSLSSGICGRVATTGKAEWVVDVHADPAYIDAHPDVTSEICAPFRALGETRGVLNIESSSRAPLSMRDLRLIEEVVNLLGIALEREQLATTAVSVEQRLQAALDAASLGVWTWTIATDSLEWLFGDNQEDAVRLLAPVGRSAELAARISAGDVGYLEHSLHRAKIDGDFDVDVQLSAPSGIPLWLNLRGHAIDVGPDGRPVRIAGVVMDVTGRKRLEEERLRLVHLETERANAEHAQRVMATTIERLTDGFVATDRDLRVTLVNEPAAALLGQAREELIGLSLIEATAGFSDESSRKRLLDTALAPLPSAFDAYDPETGRFIDIHIFPGSGGVTIHLRDVTMLRQAEYEQHRIEARFRSLVQEASDLMLIVDRTGVVTFCSPAIERILGYLPEEIIGSERRDFIYPTDIKRLQRVFLRVSRTPGLGQSIELRLIHRDGSFRWIEVTPTNLLSDPSIRGIVANCRDVTERHEAEFRLWLMAEASSILGSSLDIETMIDGLNRLLTSYLFDFSAVAIETADGRLVHFRDSFRRNPTTRRADSGLIGRGIVTLAQRSREQGIPAAEGRSLSVSDLLDQAHTGAIGPLLEHLRANGITTVSPAPVTMRNDERGALIVGSARPFSPAETTLFFDIARRLGLALENAFLYRHAQEALSSRDRFLSIAAHELRTPITSVTGYVEMLGKELRSRNDPARIERYVSRLDEAGKRLAGLTEDLLDVSRIRGGQMSIRLRRVQLDELIARIVQSFLDRSDAESPRIELQMLSPGIVITGDADRLEQVMTNLLSNALKYSPVESPVRVVMMMEGSMVLVSVQDQGIGVEPAALEMIFQPFGRASNAVQSDVPGLGLGLHIARTIVNRHGGRIWAESDGIGSGLRVTVALPLGTDHA